MEQDRNCHDVFKARLLNSITELIHICNIPWLCFFLTSRLGKVSLFCVHFSNRILLIFPIGFLAFHKNVKLKRKESNASSSIYSSFVIDEELPRADPPSLDNHVTYESSVRLCSSHFFKIQLLHVREYKYRLKGKETNKHNVKATNCYFKLTTE